ncbi:DUF3164 family protein [Vibrio parahaemolyticus]|uniref:DUF3164 family protein n=1 Tax=Vibrio parahaemolyticus TaxID=670 RepID=UPI001C58C3B4
MNCQGKREQQAQLRAFKELAFGECAAFLELLGEKYSVERGGRKGNVTFTSYDGRRQVIVAMHGQHHVWSRAANRKTTD